MYFLWIIRYNKGILCNPCIIGTLFPLFPCWTSGRHMSLLHMLKRYKYPEIFVKKHLLLRNHQEVNTLSTWLENSLFCPFSSLELWEVSYLFYTLRSRYRRHSSINKNTSRKPKLYRDLCVVFVQIHPFSNCILK